MKRRAITSAIARTRRTLKIMLESTLVDLTYLLICSCSDATLDERNRQLMTLGITNRSSLRTSTRSSFTGAVERSVRCGRNLTQLRRSKAKLWNFPCLIHFMRKYVLAWLLLVWSRLETRPSHQQTSDNGWGRHTVSRTDAAQSRRSGVTSQVTLKVQYIWLGSALTAGLEVFRARESYRKLSLCVGSTHTHQPCFTTSSSIVRTRDYWTQITLKAVECVPLWSISAVSCPMVRIDELK